MKRLLILAAATLGLGGCHHGETPAAANDNGANITTVDANAMPEDADTTDVPADEGGAPGDAESNAK